VDGGVDVEGGVSTCLVCSRHSPVEVLKHCTFQVYCIASPYWRQTVCNCVPLLVSRWSPDPLLFCPVLTALLCAMLCCAVLCFQVCCC
jgi:hypothetical protein